MAKQHISSFACIKVGRKVNIPARVAVQHQTLIDLHAISFSVRDGSTDIGTYSSICLILNQAQLLVVMVIQYTARIELRCDVINCLVTMSSKYPCDSAQRS